MPVKYVGYHRELWQSTSPVLVTDSGAVFSADDQVRIYRTGVAAYFLTLVLCQGVHVFLAKTRRTSVFVHPVFMNRLTAAGVGVAVCVAAVVIYVPGINGFFLTHPVSVAWWTVFLIFAAFAMPYTELVKFAARRHPGSRSCWSRSRVW